VGGIPEVVEDGVTGVLAAPEPAAFAAALAPLVASAELRRRMGEAGRRRVLARFGPDRQAAAVAELLAGLLRQRTAGTPARAARLA
jgi:glycosyltransferase involved in cell wall biosynthesis